MEKRPPAEGSGLVDLVAEIELRMTGSSLFPGLGDAGVIPNAQTYVVVLFDGLGRAQLGHDHAAIFGSSLASVLSAPFPTTTSVALAVIASGRPPSQNGQVAHLTWYPDLQQVVNTLKWVTPTGEAVPYEYGGLLDRPNLWERLRAAGVEPITVQPGDFSGSPLSRALYRGARFEGAWDADDLAEATIALAGEPRRLIFTYVPFVDVAGHVFGQGAEEFSHAMRLAAGVWERIVAGLPPWAAVIGTADHGLMEVADADKILVRDPGFDALRFAGDPRGIHLWGDPSLMDRLAAETGGELVDPLSLLGPQPTEKTLSHLGERLLLAASGTVILPRGFDKRLRCYHGGLMPEEVEIPLLLG